MSDVPDDFGMGERVPRTDRAWIHQALDRLDREEEATASTSRRLEVFPLPPEWGVRLYLKDESAWPTGSLKHPAARELFRYCLLNGWIGPETPVIEATSGNAGVSAAYFAKLLGLEFTAVLPQKTGTAKLARLEEYGTHFSFVERPPDIYDAATALAENVGGRYIDHFAYGERAADWRSDRGLPGALFRLLADEPAPVPAWIVAGVGSGTTATAFGRHIRHRRYSTRIAAVDPEHSAYFPGWATGAHDYTTGMPSRIEGIGRPRMEAGFYPETVDRVIPVPDAASVAAMRTLSPVMGGLVGPSSGTTLWGALGLVAGMLREGTTGSVVALVGDRGEHYRATYYSDEWVESRGLKTEPYTRTLERLLRTGEWIPPEND